MTALALVPTRLNGLFPKVFPGRIPLYGLNEPNWRDFISNYAYYMLHPLNDWQRIWVNDKLTLRYALDSEGFSNLIPRYFLYVQPDGRFTYLMDAPHDIPRDERFLQCLLEREGILAMKPNNGAGGRRKQSLFWWRWRRKRTCCLRLGNRFGRAFSRLRYRIFAAGRMFSCLPRCWDERGSSRGSRGQRACSCVLCYEGFQSCRSSRKRSASYGEGPLEAPQEHLETRK